jgi:hypothetical protein
MCAAERAFQLPKTETCLERTWRRLKVGIPSLLLSEVRLKRSALSATALTG